MPKDLVDTKLLKSLGWRFGEGYFDVCRGCKRRVGFQYGWRSPKYTIYHERCLARSKRYAEIVKRANKASSRLVEGGGDSPAYIIRHTGEKPA